MITDRMAVVVFVTPALLDGAVLVTVGGLKLDGDVLRDRVGTVETIVAAQKYKR